MEDNEVKNDVKEIRRAIKLAKMIFITNPLTEGYVRVVKSDLLRDIADWVDDTEMNDQMYIRFGTTIHDSTYLYIN